MIPVQQVFLKNILVLDLKLSREKAIQVGEKYK